MLKSLVELHGFAYTSILRPLIFQFNSELVHERFTQLGESIGNVPLANNILRNLMRFEDNSLTQTIANITFGNPVGLAAGFDYEAKLTQVLPTIGFGFGTIGTITNRAYKGNPPPLLGRLPKSKSLLVNKGFKNSGVKVIIQKLKRYHFDIPIGISIGRTNTTKFKTLKQAIDDIKQAYKVVEKSKLPFSYYELNISCPNLYGKIDFYPPKNLDKLLTEIDKLILSRPVFIKMPINNPNENIKDMLNIINKHNITGVIFGNLQKDRSDPSLDPTEVAKYERGYFSGKPTEKRSNELISLTYKLSGKKLVIIGCGGVFSAEDAYKKIRLGATLVQLITGLIYQGPQLPTQVNYGLIKLLKKDGFKHISEAIGIDSR